jgi:membrane protease YdiL (CAAX protease family)
MLHSNLDHRNSISDRQRRYEITAVLLTAVGKLVFMDVLHWKLFFIILSILAWAGYVIFQSRKAPGILWYWGFRTDNFKEVIIKILPFGIVSLIAFFVVGYYQGTMNLNWNIIPILILYPIWGIVQQLLVIGLVGGNLQDMKEIRINKFVIIALTALLFGLVHFPFYWLMAATFFLALLYGFIYLKSRNLYVLGLFHGWLGCLFYYTVLDRDPFAEIFGNLFHYL